MATGSVQTPERVRVRRSPSNDPGEGRDGPILLKSNLHKKGKRFKIWHQRYFEIQGTHMYYYKNSNKSDCLGEIDLTLCTFCGPSDEATFGAPFEIRTTLRTHVMSARSIEERDQWIEVIRNQSRGSKPSNSKETTKPKRWRTFRNAFGKNRHKKSQENLLSSAAPTTPSKRGTIFGRLKRKTSGATMRQANTETNLHKDRPLSLTEDNMGMDYLEQILDAQPSRSLPATPLARRRSNPMLFPQLEEKLAIDSTQTLPKKLPSLTVSAPTEEFDIETEEKLPAIDLISPPSGFRENSSREVSASERNHSEVTSLDAKSTADDEVFDSGTPVEKEAPAAPLAVTVPVERERYVIKEEAWGEIRTILAEESGDVGNNIINSSLNDAVSNQDEPWRNMSSAIEGLRAFLETSD